MTLKSLAMTPIFLWPIISTTVGDTDSLSRLYKLARYRKSNLGYQISTYLLSIRGISGYNNHVNKNEILKIEITYYR